MSEGVPSPVAPFFLSNLTSIVAVSVGVVQVGTGLTHDMTS